ncbi:MAG: L-lactate dehydrogenase [Alphaproteobacteria bacterium]|nr:L-lactate dehydrogenase [Alphaproteobacteria bacterium]
MTKISVIGAGFVGSTGTYALMLKEVADEIALIDINADLVAAEVADINQGFNGLSKTRVKIGTYADCSNSDLIIVTAGLGRKVGESRLDLLNKNIKIMEEISAQINKTDTNAFVLVVSNPVDVLTYKLSKMITAPVKGVFGSGCALDTSRLISVLADKFNEPVDNIEGFVIGEHGDSQIVDWDSVKICGLPIDKYCASKEIKFTADDKQEIAEVVKKYGMTIISGKGRTNYGIGTSICMISEALLKNKGTLLSVALPDDTLETATSRPHIVDAKGVH